MEIGLSALDGWAAFFFTNCFTTGLAAAALPFATDFGEGAFTDLVAVLALALTGTGDFLIGLVGLVGFGEGLVALGEDLAAGLRTGFAFLTALAAGFALGALAAGFALAGLAVGFDLADVVGFLAAAFLEAKEVLDLDLLLLAEVLATDLDVVFFAGLAMNGGGLKDDQSALARSASEISRFRLRGAETSILIAGMQQVFHTLAYSQ